MKWEEYYDKFYDWSESTQISKMSGLTDFTSSEEICEILIELQEKAELSLLKKALSQNVSFTPKQIFDICEYVEEETFAMLIKSCGEPFTLSQLAYMGNYSTLPVSDIKELIVAPVRYVDLTWDEYYSIFHELSEEDQVRAALGIKDFSAVDEVKDIIYCLADNIDAEDFIYNALDSGLALSVSEIVDLIEFDNRDLNQKLISDNFERLIQELDLDTIDSLVDYLYEEDYTDLKQAVEENRRGRLSDEDDKRMVSPPNEKVNLLTAVGMGILGAKALNHVWGDNEKEKNE